MTEEQLLLAQLAEECGEVAQVASKALRFGPDNYHPDDPEKKKNRDKLVLEFNDIVGVMMELNERGVIEYPIDMNLIHQKRAKINRYLKVSQENNSPKSIA